MDWGYRFIMRLDRKGGIKASVHVDYFSFKGKTLGDKLIKKFPTLSGLGSKSYNHKEVELYYNEYYPYFTDLVNAKGDDAPFDWFHSDPNIEHPSL